MLNTLSILDQLNPSCELSDFNCIHVAGYVNSDHSFSGIVPRKSINEMAKFLSDQSGDAELKINVLDTYGTTPLATFGCTGQIFDNNLTVTEGGYIDGTISVSQEYLTGRAFY